MQFSDKVISKTREIGIPLCLGLDPHPHLIPKIFKPNSTKCNIKNVENFLFEIMEIANGKIVAIKPQVAFFELLGPKGMSLLIKISNFAREKNILVIMDAKRGDIGTTSKAYANAWLGENACYPSDALTVNPWMGIETLNPFIEVASHTNSGVFILLKTSNPGSSDLQDLHFDNKPLYIHLAEKLNRISKKHSGEYGYSNIGMVVGATKPSEAMLIRETLPNSLFLIPGYGAQGATAREALSGLVKRNQVYEGGLINSSRKILFPEGSYNVDNIKTWKQLIKASLENTLNDLKV